MNIYEVADCYYSEYPSYQESDYGTALDIKEAQEVNSVLNEWFSSDLGADID